MKRIVAFWASLFFSSLAWAEPLSSEVGGSVAATSAQVDYAGRKYGVASLLSGVVEYRASFARRFSSRVAWDIVAASSDVLLQGPDLGVHWFAWGRPGFEVSEAPFTLRASYLFDVHLSGGVSLRRFSFTTLVSESERIFATDDTLPESGWMWGGNASLGVGTDISTVVRLSLDGAVTELRGMDSPGLKMRVLALRAGILMRL